MIEEGKINPAVVRMRIVLNVDFNEKEYWIDPLASFIYQNNNSTIVYFIRNGREQVGFFMFSTRESQGNSEFGLFTTTNIQDSESTYPPPSINDMETTLSFSNKYYNSRDYQFPIGFDNCYLPN